MIQLPSSRAPLLAVPVLGGTSVVAFARCMRRAWRTMAQWGRPHLRVVGTQVHAEHRSVTVWQSRVAIVRAITLACTGMAIQPLCVRRPTASTLVPRVRWRGARGARRRRGIAMRTMRGGGATGHRMAGGSPRRVVRWQVVSVRMLHAASANPTTRGGELTVTRWGRLRPMFRSGRVRAAGTSAYWLKGTPTRTSAAVCRSIAWSWRRCLAVLCCLRKMCITGTVIRRTMPPRIWSYGCGRNRAASGLMTSWPGPAKFSRAMGRM